MCDLTSVSGATAARSVGFIWNGRGAEIENHTHTLVYQLELLALKVNDPISMSMFDMLLLTVFGQQPAC